MAQLDIQLDDRPRRVRNGRVNGRGEYQLLQQLRPRGIVGQLTALVLQPGVFFRTLPAVQHSRVWLLVAVLLLAVTGAMAVRQAGLDAGPAAPMGGEMGMPPDMLDAGMMGDFGGLPPDMMGPGPDVGTGAPTGTAGVSTTWTTALVAAGGLLLVWLVQAVLLSEVSLFNGRAPRLGLNLQIAVYASVPLALMTGLQALYLGAGGTVGAPGLTGLVTEWSGFAGQTPLVQALLLSLASNLTLFWLWGLALLYLGARHALRGRWWASLLVVFAWVAVLVVTPVASGAVTAPIAEDALALDALPDSLPNVDAEFDGMDEGRPFEPPVEEGVGQAEGGRRAPAGVDVETIEAIPAS